jgi:hypothetical protein
MTTIADRLANASPDLAREAQRLVESLQRMSSEGRKLLLARLRANRRGKTPAGSLSCSSLIAGRFGASFILNTSPSLRPAPPIWSGLSSPAIASARRQRPALKWYVI